MPGALTDVKPAPEVDRWGEALGGGVVRGIRAAAGHVQQEAQAALQRNVDPWGNAFAPNTPTTLHFYATVGDPRGSITGSLRVTVEDDGKRGVVRAGGRARRYARVKQYGNPNNRMFDNAKLAPILARAFLPIRESGAVDIPPAMSAAILAALEQGIARAFVRAR